MLQKLKQHKNNKESHLYNRWQTGLKQSYNSIRVKFSRYKQNQILINVSFDTLINIVEPAIPFYMIGGIKNGCY